MLKVLNRVLETARAVEVRIVSYCDSRSPYTTPMGFRSSYTALIVSNMLNTGKEI